MSAWTNRMATKDIALEGNAILPRSRGYGRCLPCQSSVPPMRGCAAFLSTFSISLISLIVFPCLHALSCLLMPHMHTSKFKRLNHTLNYPRFSPAPLSPSPLLSSFFALYPDSKLSLPSFSLTVLVHSLASSKPPTSNLPSLLSQTVAPLPRSPLSPSHFSASPPLSLSISSSLSPSLQHLVFSPPVPLRRLAPRCNTGIQWCCGNNYGAGTHTHNSNQKTVAGLPLPRPTVEPGGLSFKRLHQRAARAPDPTLRLPHRRTVAALDPSP
eukprot:470896-Rhodomonas_salina.9